MNDPTRKRIGGYTSFGTRASIYEAADGLEVDSTDHATISRLRVLFEDVLLITRHRELGTGYLFTMGFFAGLFLFVALISIPFGNYTVATIFGLLALPFLILFAVRLATGIEVVTVFGRRSKAVMRFSNRAKGAEVYGRLCATVRAAQRKLAEEMAALEPPPAVETPPMPEEEQPPMPPAEA